MSAPASVICTLCGASGSVDTDVHRPSGVATALAWAVHFASEHPDAPGDASAHLVMTEATR